MSEIIVKPSDFPQHKRFPINFVQFINSRSRSLPCEQNHVALVLKTADTRFGARYFEVQCDSPLGSGAFRKSLFRVGPLG